MNDKKQFIKSFFPPSVTDIQLVHMDLDQTGLTLCDILRGINTVFPDNSSGRYDMIDGHKVVAVICRSDLIEPINGIILLVSHGVEIHTSSLSYILITVDERDIKTEESLNAINNSIAMYLAKELRNKVVNFDEFYVKYVYNDYEERQYDDDFDDED